MNDIGPFCLVLLIGGVWGWYLTTVLKKDQPTEDRRAEAHDLLVEMTDRVRFMNRFTPNSTATVHFKRGSGDRFKLTIQEAEPPALEGRQ